MQQTQMPMAQQLERHLDRYKPPYTLYGRNGSGPNPVKVHITTQLGKEGLEQLAQDLQMGEERQVSRYHITPDSEPRVVRENGGTRTFHTFPRLDGLLASATTPEGERGLVGLFERYMTEESARSLASSLSVAMAELVISRKEYADWVIAEAKFMREKKPEQKVLL